MKIQVNSNLFVVHPPPHNLKQFRGKPLCIQFHFPPTLGREVMKQRFETLRLVSGLSFTRTTVDLARCSKERCVRTVADLANGYTVMSLLSNLP